MAAKHTKYGGLQVELLGTLSGRFPKNNRSDCGCFRQVRPVPLGMPPIEAYPNFVQTQFP